MKRVIKKRLALLALAVFIQWDWALAQNVRRIEEEAIKDKERDIKIQEYIKKRAEEEQRIMNEPLTQKEIEEKNLVEVEPNNVLPSDLANIYALVPYKVRRKRWGHLFTITYSQYNPYNYQTDYLAPGTGSFDNLYGTDPMFELSYTYKLNFIFGSIGGEVGYGYYKNEAKAASLGDAALTLQLARVGAKVILDNLFFEPYVAPYAMAGTYVALYDESQDNATLDGNTSPAFYYGLGVLFQMNWMDPSSAVEAYTDAGIENTFLFAELRQYAKASGDKDPDFSTNMDINFGMSLEF